MSIFQSLLLNLRASQRLFYSVLWQRRRRQTLSSHHGAFSSLTSPDPTRYLIQNPNTIFLDGFHLFHYFSRLAVSSTIRVFFLLPRCSWLQSLTYFNILPRYCDSLPLFSSLFCWRESKSGEESSTSMPLSVEKLPPIPPACRSLLSVRNVIFGPHLQIKKLVDFYFFPVPKLASNQLLPLSSFICRCPLVLIAGIPDYRYRFFIRVKI